MMNCTFFDGHAKALHPVDVQTSKEISGCQLIYDWPYGGTNPPTVTSISTAPGQPNLCASFAWTGD
jgi:prepilin-type processing-associated H-X9-DG protein